MLGVKTLSFVWRAHDDWQHTLN